jgi:hypothetical protein
MHTHTHTHTYIYIYNAQKEAEMKFSCITPPRTWAKKSVASLSKNQGATGKHDEQYQMLTETWMSFSMR